MICRTSQNRPLFRRFIEPISDGSHRNCVVLINGIQLHFHFLTRLPIQKKGIESLTDVALFLLLQTRTCPFSKQNYSINLSEILIGAIQKMSLNDGIQTLSQ